MFSYPLQLSFKFLTLGSKIFVKDSNDKQVLFVKMKAFKLKEDISIYENDKQEKELYRIKADRVIDFSAKYHLYKQNKEIGAIKRKGMKSLWSAHYEIMDEQGNITHNISEDSAVVKVLDALFRQIPILGMFSGYVFHPKYTLYEGSNKNNGVLKMTKKPSFLESAFTLEKLQDVSDKTVEERLVLGMMMMVLLERRRG